MSKKQTSISANNALTTNFELHATLRYEQKKRFSFFLYFLTFHANLLLLGFELNMSCHFIQCSYEKKYNILHYLLIYFELCHLILFVEIKFYYFCSKYFRSSSIFLYFFLLYWILINSFPLFDYSGESFWFHINSREKIWWWYQ